jgi:predicted O-methyltransferase YrrM
MTDSLWSEVDRYIVDLLVPADAVLDAAQESIVSAGLPPISVSPAHGKLLHLLARLHQARSILEIGTLGGYSTIWMARALPDDGRLITLEIDPKHAEVAHLNIARAELSSRVELRLGRALDTLEELEAEGAGPFDMIFIDADKASIPEYFEYALGMSRRGTLIVVDNVIRSGAVIDAESTDPNIQGIRRFNEMLAAEPRVSATELQTVGSKGYDGFAFVLVIADP